MIILHLEWQEVLLRRDGLHQRSQLRTVRQLRLMKVWLMYAWIITCLLYTSITVSKIVEVQKDFSPRIVKAKGSIQQYPDWNEDEFDYE